MHPVVQQLLERSDHNASIASRIAGVSKRHITKWRNGHSSPSPRSLTQIVAHLDGDNLLDRHRRVERYADRAQKGLPIFG